MFFNSITSSSFASRRLILNYFHKTMKHLPALSVASHQQLRSKYLQNKGVKGIRNRKHQFESMERTENSESNDVGDDQSQQELNIENSEYDLVAHGAMNVSRQSKEPQNVLIIQPYIKWGSKKSKLITPDEQLEECKALIHSITNWSVALAIKVPLETLGRKSLFGKGKMEEIRAMVSELTQAKSTQEPLTRIFVSKDSLTFAQKALLESTLNLPVMDRYSVVIQILRLHATSAEARLQVAMAEIPYIWSQAKDANMSKSTKMGYSLTDIQRDILKTREKKLKLKLERIRNHRKLLRSKRKHCNFPIVAVVGYTNAGKTSLIKALTQEQSIQPRDQLFATLDVTAHAGKLPCNLEVLYMDTVGFMSDLPTGLIECFIATLEDAMLADVIIHVQDLSHSCHQAQKEHVEVTLKTLTQNMFLEEQDGVKLPPVINVGNKIDLIESKDVVDFSGLMVSSKKQQGLPELLSEIQNHILESTNRLKLTIRLPNGGSEMSWLYKNSAVVGVKADTENSQNLLIDVVIKDIVLEQFKKQFCRK